MPSMVEHGLACPAGRKLVGGHATMAVVSLSCRQSDSAACCSRLSDHLRLRCGEGIACRDVDNLQPGVRWRQQTLACLRGAKVVLVLVLVPVPTHSDATPRCADMLILPRLSPSRHG